MSNTTSKGISWAGLVAGPAAWFLSTEANYAVASKLCQPRLSWVTIAALALVIISLAGAFLSWRALSASRDSARMAEGGHPHHLIALVGTSAGLLFSIVIGLHLIASLILPDCVR